MEMKENTATRMCRLSSMLLGVMEGFLDEQPDSDYVDEDHMYAEFACMAKDDAIAWMLDGRDFDEFLRTFPESDDCQDYLENAMRAATE